MPIRLPGPAIRRSIIPPAAAIFRSWCKPRKKRNGATPDDWPRRGLIKVYGDVLRWSVPRKRMNLSCGRSICRNRRGSDCGIGVDIGCSSGAESGHIHLVIRAILKLGIRNGSATKVIIARRIGPPRKPIWRSITNHSVAVMRVGRRPHHQNSSNAYSSNFRPARNDAESRPWPFRYVTRLNLRSLMIAWTRVTKYLWRTMSGGL